MNELFLAEVASDPMISGNWIIGVIGAIAAAAALVVGKIQGRKEGESSRQVTIVDQPVATTTTIQDPPATVKALEALRNEMHSRLKKIEGALSDDRINARHENTNVHHRIDKVVEAVSGLAGEMKHVGENVKTLLDIALKTHRP